MIIRISSDVTGRRIPRKLLSQVLVAALKLHCEKLSVKTVAVDLVVMDDKGIRSLNFKYKQSNTLTDVLAFSDLTVEAETENVHLGDIAINASLARREAEKRSLAFRNELCLYAVHGVLHLLGFLDKTEKECEVMRCRESEILAQFAIIPDWS